MTFREFLARKDIEISLRRYGIDAMAAMAQGLFCSLLIGTIIDTIGTQLEIAFLTQPLVSIRDSTYTVGGLAAAMSGPAMACAIGYALRCPPAVLFSLVTVGFSSNALGGAGGPLAVFFVAIVAAEAGKLVSKETKIDLLVTPLVTIGVGLALSAWWAPALGAWAMKFGELVMWATELRPFVMGIVVSVVVGMVLTLPISSAAICAALGLTGLAGGAAVAGCCAQMVGFAVMSFPENRWSGLVSQGIGTSMLQMGNIVKNPCIWIAPTLASAITGPIATCMRVCRADWCLHRLGEGNRRRDTGCHHGLRLGRTPSGLLHPACHSGTPYQLRGSPHGTCARWGYDAAGVTQGSKQLASFGGGSYQAVNLQF